MKIPKVKLPKMPTRQQIKRAMPTVMAVVSVVGNCAAAYLFIDRTIKATRIIDQANAEGTLTPTGKKELAKKVVPQYVLPTVIFIGAQICTIECNILNRRQQVSLIAALAGADYRYRTYKEKVKEEKGVEEAKKIDDEIARDSYRKLSKASEFHEYCEIVGNQDDGSSTYIAPEGLVLFYDPYRDTGKCDGYFESTIIQVKQAMYHLNRNYTMRGDACLNEFYEFIGIPGTTYGEYAGWDVSELEIYWIDIELREIPIDETLVAYAIDYIFAPQVPYEAIEEGLV